MDDPQALRRAARQAIETDRELGLDAWAAPEPPTADGGEADAAAAADAPAPTDQAAALDEIDRNEVRSCRLCGLCQGRTNTVFGEGAPDADLVFVGEGPGAEEDRTGRPFVGRAGELLTKMILAMGLTREQVYICNLVKCRPPGNRTPTPDEIATCWDYLGRQLRILQPKVIVTLGNPATQNLLDTRTGITRMRGQWVKLPAFAEGLADVDVMPTFHPAYLLRQYSQDNRRKVWEDLQKVMARLGIEAPQQG